MHYYTTAELSNILVNKYFDNLKEDVCAISRECLPSNEDNPIEDASIFLSGVCQLFAYVLKLKFGYKVYKIWNGNDFHIFCKSLDEKYYIDVRGTTHSFDKFISDLLGLNKSAYNIEEYSFSCEDFAEDQFPNIGLRFAYEIINDDIARYRP